VDDRVIYNDLKAMPDTYIDRWDYNVNQPNPGFGEPFVAVWCAVVPPPDCPKPRTP